jgi:hypothetical protein
MMFFEIMDDEGRYLVGAEFPARGASVRASAEARRGAIVDFQLTSAWCAQWQG